MELWRMLGGAAVGSAGLLFVLVAMAQARDSAVATRRRGPDGKGARVARAGGISLAVLVVLMLLVLTVLPQLIVWGLGAALWLILLALFLAG
jgi:hypothetical protein